MAVVLIVAIVGFTVIASVFIICQQRIRLAELALRREQLKLDRAGVVTPEQVTDGLARGVVQAVTEHAALMNFRFPPGR